MKTSTVFAAFVIVVSSALSAVADVQTWTDVKGRTAVVKEKKYGKAWEKIPVEETGIDPKGKWNGRQLVPEKWVEESTKPFTRFGGGSGYGYMWWIEPIGGAYNRQ